MEDDDLVVVATCPSIQEASILRSVLDANGITSCLGGAETATTLWHYGTALGGVRVLTAKRDSEQAKVALSLRRHNASQDSEWKCPRCGSIVDAGFDVCWSCGRALDGTSNFEDEAESVADSSEVGFAADLPNTDEITLEPAVEVDDTELRAYRSAIIGLLFLPAFFYSMYLLVKLAVQDSNRPTTWRFAVAIAINLLVFAAWWSIIIM
jgi:hypothetical protein